MSRYLRVHPDNPQPRLIQQAVGIVREGGMIVYPTDSSYALGCHLGDKAALERIRKLRRLDTGHDLTLVCRDLSEIAIYAKIDNRAYRLLRALTPGPYTFVLRATHEVPRRLQHPRKKTIGIRIPDNRIALALLEGLGEPMMSTTMRLPGEEFPLSEGWDIQELLEHQLDAVVDGGACGLDPTTVIDMVADPPEVRRKGLGDTSLFGG